MYAPGNAAHAVGVPVSGLKMSENRTRMQWKQEKVDIKLQGTILNIHKSYQKYYTNSTGYIDYVKGANVAGFVKVAHTMIGQGVV